MHDFLAFVLCLCFDSSLLSPNFFMNTPPSSPSVSEPQNRITHWTNAFFAAQLAIQDLCTMAKGLNAGIDLPPQVDWSAIKDAGVTIGSVTADMGKDAEGQKIAPFAVGFNDPKHATLVRQKTIETLEAAFKAGIKHMIVFTGMDTGEDRQVQFDRIVQGFTEKPGGGESIMEIAKRCGITMDMEMLNSKADPVTWRGHPGYLGDSTDEVAALVRKIREASGSDNIGLLFDLYHVATMGEDIHAKIDAHNDVITYAHAAGQKRNADGTPAPDTRGSLTEEGQVIDYAKAIAHLRGYLPDVPLLQEFISKETDPEKVREEIRAAIKVCFSHEPGTISTK